MAATATTEPASARLGEQALPLVTPRLGRYLLACLRGGPADLPEADELDMLPMLAAYHRIPGFIAPRLQSDRLSGPAVDAVIEQARVALVMHLHVLSDLALLGRSFDDAGIRYVTMKGPVLSDLVYDRPDRRIYGDLDLLIAPERLGVALDRLADLGVVPLCEPWEQLVQNRRAQMSLRMPSGVNLDLHWSYFNNPDVRRAFPVDVAGVLDRSRHAQLGSTVASVQDDVDRLIHVAAHATFSGAFRLGWTEDVHRCVTAGAIDWDALIARCQTAGLGLPVAVMLARARDLLGAPVPKAALWALTSPYGWLLFTRALTRFRSPAGHALIGTGHYLISRTRESLGATVRDLLRHGGREALLPALRMQGHPWHRLLWRRWDGGEAESVGPELAVWGLKDDPSGRAGFLRWVDNGG